MFIRELNLNDLVQYTTFILKGAKESPTSFRVSPQDILSNPASFLTGTPDDFTLGAFSEDNELLGVVSFERERREKLRHKGTLCRMYVADQASEHGVGRALMQETIEKARAQTGLKKINLTVFNFNVRAKQLYTTEGFTSFALESDSLKIGENYFDEEQMELHL